MSVVEAGLELAEEPVHTGYSGHCQTADRFARHKGWNKGGAGQFALAANCPAWVV
jgi:hypothetical protein